MVKIQRTSYSVSCSSRTRNLQGQISRALAAQVCHNTVKPYHCELSGSDTADPDRYTAWRHDCRHVVWWGAGSYVVARGTWLRRVDTGGQSSRHNLRHSSVPELDRDSLFSAAKEWKRNLTVSSWRLFVASRAYETVSLTRFLIYNKVLSRFLAIAYQVN